MFKQGEWVVYTPRGQTMRIAQDQRKSDDGQVFCEWRDGGYHREAHHESDLKPLQRDEWPQEL
jgi:uncharacterized protein YodC (DUF2158 family)